MRSALVSAAVLAISACGGGSGAGPDDLTPNPNGPDDGPKLAGCPVLPGNHVFNARIDGLRVHPRSEAFLGTIGDHPVHLDLGTQTDQSQGDFYGIPYNVVQGNAGSWTHTVYADSGMGDESDCSAASDASHATVTPCNGSALTNAAFPFPASPTIEGGISSNTAIYGDHHLLLFDSDNCELWELGNVYHPASGWQTGWTAYFDLRSNALREAGWTSADAAGFPILPLLLRADEAATGEIRHAFRFTIGSSKIRRSYTWPARHLTTNGTSSDALPPMGQLFRLKADHQVPANASTQSRAIIEALQRYGMYVADGGTDMYVTGAPSADWDDDVFATVQSLRTGDFEAVDLEAVASARPGFDIDSGALP